MNRQKVIEELTEFLRTSSQLRHRLGIAEGDTLAPLQETPDGEPVGLGWLDKDGNDVVLRVYTREDDADDDE